MELLVFPLLTRACSDSDLIVFGASLLVLSSDSLLSALSASHDRDIFILNERTAEKSAALYDISVMKQEIVESSNLKSPQRA